MRRGERGWGGRHGSHLLVVVNKPGARHGLQLVDELLERLGVALLLGEGAMERHNGAAVQLRPLVGLAGLAVVAAPVEVFVVDRNLRGNETKEKKRRREG